MIFTGVSPTIPYPAGLVQLSASKQLQFYHLYLAASKARHIGLSEEFYELKMIIITEF